MTSAFLVFTTGAVRKAKSELTLLTVPTLPRTTAATRTICIFPWPLSGIGLRLLCRGEMLGFVSASCKAMFPGVQNITTETLQSYSDGNVQPMLLLDVRREDEVEVRIPFRICTR